MLDLRHRNEAGGQWHYPGPIEGLTPILPELSDYERLTDYEQAVQIAEACFAGENLDGFYEDLGIDPAPGPILEPWVRETMARFDVGWGMGQAIMVGMDTMPQLVDKICRYAISEVRAGRAEFSHLLRPNRDEVRPEDTDMTAVIAALPEFLMAPSPRRGLDLGLTDVFTITMAEKEHWEDWLEANAKIYGWRPHMTAIHLSGHARTAYANYSPYMGDRPQGHSTSWAFVCERAAMAISGDGFDRMIRNMALHSGMARIQAFVHGPQSLFGGIQIGTDGARGRYDEFAGAIPL